MKIIVFDDDPTGSQTVNNCLLLLRWDYKTLLKGFKSKTNLFFILANTRSLSAKDAENRLEEICKTINLLIKKEGLQKEDLIFVSRGDSTLRGHNYLEPKILNKFLGPFDGTFYIPAFIEGKRFTINGNHYVEGTPAHKTSFAHDHIFGYETNNIKNLLYEKSNFKINLNKIRNLTLSDLETLEINEINNTYSFLKNMKNNYQVIVDASDYSHLNKFVKVIKSLYPNKFFLFRTAASFISSLSKKDKNNKENLKNFQTKKNNSKKNLKSGLIVVGSHVETTTNQLNNLLTLDSCKPIEIDIFEFNDLLKSKNSFEKLLFLKNKILKEIRYIFSESLTPVLFTSRQYLDLGSDILRINFNRKLAYFIAEIVSEIKFDIGYLISKGGNTTNAILSDGLKVDYVYLEGQIIDGISLVSLRLNNNDILPMVTFPGNIGDRKSLIKIWSYMENSKI